MKLVEIILIAFLGLCIFPVEAQEKNKGSAILEGTVLDEKSKPIEGAEIYFRYYINKKDTRLLTSCVTDKNGKYKFENMKPGKYQITLTNDERDVIDPDRHAFFADEGSPWIDKEVEIKKGEKEKRCDFKLVLAARVVGKITYSDGSPLKGTERFEDITNRWWGTGVKIKKDGAYEIKGLHPKVKFLTVKAVYGVFKEEKKKGMYLAKITRFFKDIPLKEGKATKKDIILKIPDFTKLSIKAKCYINDILYASKNAKKLKPLGMWMDGVSIIYVRIKDKNTGFTYSPGFNEEGEVLLYDVKPGKYTIEAGYDGRASKFFKELYKTSMFGKKEVGIKKDKTLKLTVNFDLKKNIVEIKIVK